MPKLTHDELVGRAVKWLVGTGGCRFAVPEIDVGLVWEKPDALGWTCYEKTILIECKASRGDFLGDKKKSFRRTPQLGMGYHRYYFCAPDLIQKDELPDGWGLLWCYPKIVKRVSYSRWSGFTDRDCRSEKQIMFALLRRAQLNGSLKACLSPKWQEVDDARHTS